MSAPAEPPSTTAPARDWLPVWAVGWQPKWLVGDAVAGVTLAAYLLPAAIGDASLANLPPETGIYACLFAGFVFWLFCSSRHTSITVTSAISLLLGASLGELGGGDPARCAALAAATALLVGAFALIAWLVRAGSIVNFISETVMTGFKTGIALVLASTQLPKLFGFPGAHGGSFWHRAGHFLEHLGDTNPVALGLGGGAFALLLAGKWLLPGRPVALVVVALGIAIAAWCDLGAAGVKLLGAVPAGVPVPALPPISLQDLDDLVPLAFACFLLAAVETTAIGRMFGRKHGYRIDADREFLAIAAANAAAGLGGGFAVSGGMSQSLVNESGGARTPLSGLFAAVLMLLVALLLSGLLASLPQPVLAAIVLMAVTSLFKLSALRRLWHAHRAEFWIAIAALLGVLGAGILRGVFVGAILSVGLLLRRAARPHVAELGRIPGLQRFSDLARHPDNQRIPGLLLVRVEAALLYFSAEFVRNAILARVRAAEPPVRTVICDLSSSPYVDMAGAEMLSELHEDLGRRGIPFHVVEARSKVRDMLRLEGLEQRFGHISRRASLAEAVAAFEADPEHTEPAR